MVAQQKIAWFNLAVLTAAVSTYIILWLLIGASPALGAFGICGLLGLAPIVFRRDGRRHVAFDERDQLISTRATLLGFRIFWISFVAACMLIWGVIAYIHGRDTVPVDVLPLVVLGGWFIFMLAHSLALVIQYARSSHEE